LVLLRWRSERRWVPKGKTLICISSAPPLRSFAAACQISNTGHPSQSPVLPEVHVKLGLF